MSDNPLAIDQNRLETEWSGQAALFLGYAQQLADAKLEQDDAKAELDVTSAELDSLIRTDPDSYGIQRVSEAAIKNTILQQASYQQVHAVHLKAIHSVRMLDAMVQALEHRRSALKHMVELRLSQYYSEPALPKQNREEMTERRTKKVRARGRKKSRK